MKSIFLIGIMAIAFVFPSYAAITNDDVQQASQVYCTTLKAGKSEEEAKKAANDYLIGKVKKDETVDLGEIRKQMRQSILNTCPDQGKK